ncbi:MAG: nucleotidyltransferase domain-containing protein [Spirochaetia bacterium]|nr:nucleotidyltransferase domain-containing protein [Spirochaetia bacterium]
MKLNEPVFWVLNSRHSLKLLSFLLADRELPEMSERQLARMVKIPTATVNRLMADFESINLLYYRYAGNSRLWRVNKESYAYNALKGFADAAKAENTPAGELVRILREKLRKLPVTEAILFGSVARGEEKENSDIDLYVLVKEEKYKEPVEEGIDSIVSEVLGKYGNVLMTYMITEKEKSSAARAKLLKEINKGIRLI